MICLLKISKENFLIVKYLIFRTDRIGDFLITAPLIHAFKNKKSKSIICVVASTKNYEFIKNHIINTTEKAFDDFADSGADIKANKKMLGIS